MIAHSTTRTARLWLEHECEARGIAASVWAGRLGRKVAVEQEALFSKAALAPLCTSCEAREAA